MFGLKFGKKVKKQDLSSLLAKRESVLGVFTDAITELKQTNAAIDSEVDSLAAQRDAIEQTMETAVAIRSANDNTISKMEDIVG